MRTTSKYLAWTTAAFCALMIISIEYVFGSAFGEEGQSRLSLAVYSIGFGVLTQAGLFISPWAEEFKTRYKLVVLTSMLPTIWVLLSRLSEDILISSRGLSWGRHAEPQFDFLYALVLAVYATQVVILVSSIISQRRHAMK